MYTMLRYKTQYFLIRLSSLRLRLKPRAPKYRFLSLSPLVYFFFDKNKSAFRLSYFRAYIMNAARVQPLSFVLVIIALARTHTLWHRIMYRLIQPIHTPSLTVREKSRRRTISGRRVTPFSKIAVWSAATLSTLLAIGQGSGRSGTRASREIQSVK